MCGIAGFDERKNSVLENQLRLNCNKFHVMYKDGMHERRGDILMPLKKTIVDENPVGIYAHTAAQTMKDISRIASDSGVPLWVNVIGLVEPRPSFVDTEMVLLKGDFYSPSRDGLWVNAAQLDVNAFIDEIRALKEYAQCRRNEADVSASKNVWARLKKFIWG